MKRIRDYVASASIYAQLPLLTGLLILVPLLVLPFYRDEVIYAHCFVIPAIVSALFGLILCGIGRKKPGSDIKNLSWQSSLQRGSLPVLYSWCFGILAGALPFMIADILPPLLAFFESASGWTTTGLTVVDVTKMPKIFLFHRSFMQYCGGLGFILMILIVSGGNLAVSMYDAEGHPDRLAPNLKGTAKTILLIYICFLIGGSFIYSILGMHPFDSICHTMSALSTAGFTTQAASIGTYNSYPIEVFTIVLMLVGSTNFAVLLLLTRFQFKKLLRVSELRFMFLLIAVTTPLAGICLAANYDMNLFQGLHHALFGIVTTFTTSGYATMDYAVWPPFALGILMVLMIIGGSIGSTAGGIKLSRTYLLLCISSVYIKKKVSPSRTVTVQKYRRPNDTALIDHALVMDTLGFVFCYIAVFIVGTLLITLTEGCELFDAMFEFASALGTVGISNGITSPNAAPGTLIIEIIGMVLGRLEVFIVFLGIHTALSKLFGAIGKAKLRL